MTVRVFSTGRVRPKRAARGVRRYLVDEWGDTTLPVNVFLVEHPGGLCLVDTGQTAAATRPGHFPWWYPFFRLSRFELEPADEASRQLEAAGIDLARVRWVVLTHMHTDHVGGIASFPEAEVLVGRVEWERARGFGGRLRGYLPQHWPAGRVPRAISFEGPAIGPFASSHDVAGDGRLLMVPMPGHTPGHAGLLVRGDSARSHLCAGDVAMTAAELADAAPEVAAWCREHGVVILASHDDAAPRLLSEPILPGAPNPGHAPLR